MLEIRLHQIKEILQSDASCEIKTQRKGNDLKTTIKIEDNRFYNIRQLVKQIEQKNNKNYRKLIELISDYIGQIYDKEDFDNGTVCSNYYNYKQKKANDDFANQLFDYICKILKTNPDITLSIETLKKLLEQKSQLNSDEERSLRFDKLAKILSTNKTLKKSGINTNEIYQILIQTSQLSNNEVFPFLITPEQFNEDHEQVDEFLKNCYAYDFIEVTDTIRACFDEKFDRLPFVLDNTKEHFAEDLIYYLSYWRHIKTDDFNIIHKLLSDKNRKIDFHRSFANMDDCPELYEVIMSYGDKTIIRDMLEHPNTKDIYNFNSFGRSLKLCEICCYLGEYEKFLKELNKNKGAEYLSEDKKVDYHLKQDNYITFNNYPQNLRTNYILEICDSLKSQNVDYNRIIHIISLIINDDNLNYFEPDRILPKLQELLSEEDFKDLLNVIVQKQKENKITLIRHNTDTINGKFKHIINKISIKEFEEITIEYIGHQKSIGTYPTAQNDDSQDD